MTVRAGWTFGGKHFCETFAINGRRMFFIDGKITPRAVWQSAMKEARRAQAKSDAAAVEEILHETGAA